MKGLLFVNSKMNFLFNYIVHYHKLLHCCVDTRKIPMPTRGNSMITSPK